MLFSKKIVSTMMRIKNLNPNMIIISFYEKYGNHYKDGAQNKHYIFLYKTQILIREIKHTNDIKEHPEDLWEFCHRPTSLFHIHYSSNPHKTLFSKSGFRFCKSSTKTGTCIFTH